MANILVRIDILSVQHSISVPPPATFAWLATQIENITRGSGMAITRDQQYISIVVSYLNFSKLETPTIIINFITQQPRIFGEKFWRYFCVRIAK